MVIKGFQKLTLLDYPGKTACTVFTGGCNFRCPFCHNAILVTENDDEIIGESEVFDLLNKRKGVLDGVAVTGGEPLIQKDIERFLFDIKNKGFLVKLDTNGYFPERLKNIIDGGLCDYVAMDVKNCHEKYAETVGVKKLDIKPIEKSVELLLKNKVDFEFRTTVVGDFHTVDDIKKLSEWIQGAKKYYLQNFVDSGNLIDESCSGVSKDTMLEMKKAAREFVPNTEIRGL